MYFDYSTNEQAQRALNWFAIDNLFSAHCYCLRSCKYRYELDNLWSSRKDIAFSEGNNCYFGRESVYRVYAEREEVMQQEKLKLLHTLYPEEIPLSVEALGVGDLNLLHSGSVYIEVAKDGQTAKGVWYTYGMTAEPRDNGVPQAFLHAGRVAVEFIKEGDDWKIWHYRTSPDFSYQIPEDTFLAGTKQKCTIHPADENCPQPNMTLRPYAQGKSYSATHFLESKPPIHDCYETWQLQSSFVCPEDENQWVWTDDAGTKPDLNNAENDAKYAANYIEVLNVSSSHCYGYGSQQMVQELDRFWAQRTENVAGCHADRAHQGHNIQYKYYAHGNRGMNWGKVKIMHELFPDRVALDPCNLGIGELVIRFYTSPYIVIADDCKTAQGVWYDFGISSEIDKKGHPVPFMQWGREMMDFVLEGDSWRCLHFRLSADFDYLIDGDILLGIGLEDGIPRTVPIKKPEPDMKLQSFPMDEIYSPFRVADYSPEPPFPFETWDNRSSWFLPENIE
jgi:hypothetical protein